MSQWTVAGSLLWQARTEARMTQRQLAEVANIPQSTVAAIETGRRQPSIPLLQRLIAAAGKELRFVLADADDHDASILPDRARDAGVARRFRGARVVG